VHVRWIELIGFRGYTSLTFAPEPGLNVLVGRNGQGKTSLLEALYVLLIGRSFRTAKLADCLGWDAGGRAMVVGELAAGSRMREVRLELLAREGGIEVRGTLCPWAGAVSFAAADLALLAGGPHLRRAYLDAATARLVPVHAEACRRYRLVLQQRTRLLGDLTGRPDGDRLLAPWDEQLATLGSEIVHRRLEALALLADAVREVQVSLTLRPLSVEASWIARAIRSITRGRSREERTIRWTVPVTETAGARERLLRDAIVLSTGGLRPGVYQMALQLQAAGTLLVTSLRTLQLR